MEQTTDTTATNEQAPQAPAAPPNLQIGGTDRPAWLPAKFKTEAEFAAAYGELESKLGQLTAGKPAKGADAGPAALLTDGELRAYMEEVTAQGDLSAASRQALIAKGLPEGLVNQHVMGLKAVRNETMASIFDLAGGQERYAQMAEWAKENMDKESLAQFNAAVVSGNPGAARFAVQGLRAQFEASGSAPQTTNPSAARLGGKPSAASGVKMFASMKEQVHAQRDPRYAADPAYRAMVEKAIENSIRAGRY